MRDFMTSLAAYRDRRMIRILLLGAMSGFPWVLIGSSLSLWLNEDGLSRSAIGWAGLIFSIYAINFFWAPLIDRIRIPGLAAKLASAKHGFYVSRLSFFWRFWLGACFVRQKISGL